MSPQRLHEGKAPQISLRPAPASPARLDRNERRRECRVRKCLGEKARRAESFERSRLDDMLDGLSADQLAKQGRKLLALVHADRRVLVFAIRFHVLCVTSSLLRDVRTPHDSERKLTSRAVTINKDARWCECLRI